ncbi:small-subunit processome [Dissophora ornata]|nr:small-subunit processome [Dissophora ornata]
MAPGRRGGGRSGGSGDRDNNTGRKPQANNHSRKARGAAAAAAAASTSSGKSSKPNIKSLANVFSLEDEEESKSARRRKQYLDEVDNYEYNVDEIEDEDDEEIDSDDAFDEEDEEKYENFQFYGSKDRGKKTKKSTQADKKKADSDDEDMMDQEDSEEEEEEESEEEEGAEYMDISEMLNQPEEDEDFKFGGSDEEEEDEDEGEEEEEGEDEEDEDEDMEDDDDIKGTGLTSFIDSLETKPSKRKQDDTHDSSSKKARKALRERTEAYDESEYNLQAHRSSAAHSVNGSNKKKLDIFDLVSTVQDEAGFSALKKNVQALEKGSKKGKTVDTLAAPLPKIVQDRLNRQAAYDETKKEVSKWLPIVQKNRQAEHLAFPMNAPPIDSPSNATLASKFDASTEMEKEVQSVLIEGGMQEKKLMEFEELALNKMSTEEVEKRRAELRMMRDLMFREEIRAKRVSKIKSKLYHKIKKKERERNALTAEEMAELDPEQAREERLLAEQKRAEERMTLKHKNSGKWAKDQLKHGNFDPESRQAITEQIERGERLRRKIQDVDSDEEQSGGESEYSEYDDDDIEGVKARAFDELAQVEEQLAKDQDAALEAKVGKGIFAMKFMQDAAKRSKMQAEAAAEEFRKEMMEEEEMRAQSSEDEWKSDSSKVDKLQAKIKKQKAGEAGSDDEVQIDTSSFLTLSKDSQKERGLHKEEAKDASDEEEESAPAPAKSKKNGKAAKVSAAASVVDDDSDASEAEPVMVHAKTAAALSQRDLVARAFANDNVVSEFEKEKLEVMEAEKPKDVDMTLPGWGSWAGKGAKKKKNVVVKKAQPGEGVEASKRKDAKLAHVIINERRDKKAASYAVTQIPHPFKTWAQYEQSLRAPVGKEWNTNATFQKMTLPRVTTKLGKIIDPLTAPFK